MFGLVNQVTYAFRIAKQMLSFRELHKLSTRFHYDDTLQQDYDLSKLTINYEITS